MSRWRAAAMRAFASIAVCAVIGAPARAQPVEPGTPPIVAPQPNDPSAPWRPPAFEPDRKRAKDWVLLKSGELLRGDFEYMRDEEIQFDSDELEDLEIDWSDVAGFGSPKHNTYRFGNEVIVTGTAEMRAGVIRIDTGTGIRDFPSNQLYSMIEGELREIDYWSFKLGAGLTWRSGNSNQSDVTARADVKRETALTRLLVSYESAYSKVESDEITNNHRLVGYLAYFVTTRTSLAAPIVELYRDRVRNVDLRTTIAAGAGYDLIDRPRVEWNVLGGPAYQRTEFTAVEQDEPSSVEDAALLFRTGLELDITSDVDWDTTYQLVAVVTDWDRTSQHLSSVFSFEVWGPLDFDVSFVYDRIEEPAADPDGDTPESEDIQLTVGVSLEL